MTSAQHASTRVLTVVLNESDWLALRSVEPDAVGWLQKRIQERLATVRPAPVQAGLHGSSEFED